MCGNAHYVVPAYRNSCPSGQCPGSSRADVCIGWMYPTVKSADNRKTKLRLLWAHRVEQSANWSAWQQAVTGLVQAEVRTYCFGQSVRYSVRRLCVDGFVIFATFINVLVYLLIMRPSYRPHYASCPSVRPSVRPSVCPVRASNS